MRMKEAERNAEDGAWLLQKSQVQERPFTSNTPIIGPLLVRFRQMWNSVATKWYVRPLLQQQNSFNQLAVSQLQEHDQWFILQDREQTELTHDLAQMTLYLGQISQRLQALDAQLALLEAQQSDETS